MAVSIERVDCVVVGGGVVGLAIARALSLGGRMVIILEREGAIGTGVSARSSEVIHAGMYYPPGSLKAELCVKGNRMLREYASSHGVPFAMVGKLVVATGSEEVEKLVALHANGLRNGVPALKILTGAEAKRLEPQLHCDAALLSESTGIIDSHAYMLSLLGEAESSGASIAFHAPLTGGRLREDGFEVRIGGAEPMELLADQLVIAAGLNAPAVARAIGLSDVPAGHFCKGNYFSLSGKMPFSRLIYPMPPHNGVGLGIHYTVDMAGQGRFGPDAEWTAVEDYTVNSARAGAFASAIRSYWPELRDDELVPAYAGIRPKITGPGEPAADFRITDHGHTGLAALYGIESPGLTASLAIAEAVKAALLQAR